MAAMELYQIFSTQSSLSKVFDKRPDPDKKQQQKTPTTTPPKPTTKETSYQLKSSTVVFYD